MRSFEANISNFSCEESVGPLVQVDTSAKVDSLEVDETAVGPGNEDSSTFSSLPAPSVPNEHELDPVLLEFKESFPEHDIIEAQLKDKALLAEVLPQWISLNLNEKTAFLEEKCNQLNPNIKDIKIVTMLFRRPDYILNIATLKRSDMEKHMFKLKHIFVSLKSQAKLSNDHVLIFLRAAKNCGLTLHELRMIWETKPVALLGTGRFKNYYAAKNAKHLAGELVHTYYDEMQIVTEKLLKKGFMETHNKKQFVEERNEMTGALAREALASFMESHTKLALSIEEKVALYADILYTLIKVAPIDKFRTKTEGFYKATYKYAQIEELDAHIRKIISKISSHELNIYLSAWIGILQHTNDFKVMSILADGICKLIRLSRESDSFYKKTFEILLRDKIVSWDIIDLSPEITKLYHEKFHPANNECSEQYKKEASTRHIDKMVELACRHATKVDAMFQKSTADIERLYGSHALDSAEDEVASRHSPYVTQNFFNPPMLTPPEKRDYTHNDMFFAVRPLNDHEVWSEKPPKDQTQAKAAWKAAQRRLNDLGVNIKKIQFPEKNNSIIYNQEQYDAAKAYALAEQDAARAGIDTGCRKSGGLNIPSILLLPSAFKM